MYQQGLFNEYLDPIKLKEGKQLCPCCSRPLKAYGYEITKELVDIGMKILEWCIGNKNYNFLSKEIFEGHKELTQFQKLQYFGIIKRLDKSMEWRLTKTGYLFLKGSIQLSEKVWVFRNKVVLREDRMIYVGQVQLDWKTRWDWINDYILVSYEKVFFVFGNEIIPSRQKTLPTPIY